MAFKAIPVVAGKVAATLTDYPAYIKPSAITGWGAITLAEAQSSRWYSDEAKTTELAREIVSADEIHVKIPSLTTTTTIYVDYDGIRADYAVTDTYGAQATWNSNYVGVYHMKDVTTSTIGDSTANGNTGTKGSASNPAEVTGEFGTYGQEFDAETEYISFGNIMNLSNFTVVALWKYNNHETFASVLTKGTGGDYQWGIGLAGSAPADRNTHTQWQSDGNAYRSFRSTSDIRGVFHYSANVFRNGANTSIVYIDGVAETSSTSTSGTWDVSGAANVRLGQRADGSKGFSVGIVSELRLVQTNLSSDWIATEYNNLGDVATFWGTATEETNAEVTPSAVVLTSTVKQPTIATVANVQVNPARQSLTSTLLASTVVGGIGISVQPQPLNLFSELLAHSKAGGLWTPIPRVEDSDEWSPIARVGDSDSWSPIAREE